MYRTAALPSVYFALWCLSLSSLVCCSTASLAVSIVQPRIDLAGVNLPFSLFSDTHCVIPGFSRSDSLFIRAVSSTTSKRFNWGLGWMSSLSFACFSEAPTSFALANTRARAYCDVFLCDVILIFVPITVDLLAVRLSIPCVHCATKSSVSTS
jgi:hypothetical protein